MSQPDDIVNYGTGARLRAIVISISSLAALVAILGGVPAVLVRFVGHPLPDGIPPWTVIRAHLEAGTIPSPAIISVLTILAWLLWLSISLPIIAELISSLRGVATPAVALSFPGSAVLARRLVAGLFVVSTSVSSIAAAAPALAASAVAPQELLIDALAPDVAPATTDVSMVPTAEVRERGGLQRYVVGPGETLRSIAQETLGDANRWKEVRTASVGLEQADGSRLPEDVIRVTEGTLLQLPADAVSASVEPVSKTGVQVSSTPPAAAAASRTITVAKGNHFWGLAERTLTDAWGRSPTDAEITPYWAQVVEQNADRLVQPGDPNLIYPEQQFMLPPVPSEAPLTPSEDQGVDAAALRQVLALLPDAASSGSGAPTPLTDIARGAGPTASFDADAAKADASVGPAGGEGSAAASRSTPSPHPMHGARGASTTASGGSVAAETRPQPAPAVGHTESSPGAQPAPAVGHTESSSGALPASAVGQTESSSGALPASAVGQTESSPGALPAPAVASNATERSAVDPPADAIDTSADSVDLSRWAMGGVGAGLMAAALSLALRRRRRRQWQSRTEGRMPLPVSAEAQVFDTSLRQVAATDRLETTEAVLRSLSPLLPADAPAITSIAVSDSDVVLTLERYCNPPGLFTSVEESPLWQLRTDDDETRAAVAAGAENVAVLPALVSLGHDPDSGRDILVDLEYVLALDVVGSEPSAAQFVRTLAAELAASPFAEDVDVICCGFGHELCGLRRVVLVDSVEEACAEALLRYGGHGEGDESPLERRLRKPGEGQTPVVLLTTQLVDDAERAKLSELSLHGILVVAPGIDAKWSVALSPGGLRVEPLGLKLLRQDFTDDQFAALGELIEASDVTAPEVLPDPPAVTVSIADTTDPTSDVDGSEIDNQIAAHACDIEVEVLGTVNIVGADRDFSSARAIDVISYLVFHRDGANADMLKTWIWPIDEPPSDKAFANVMSRARKGLGTDDAGQPYLARADAHGNYRLLPSVRSDVDRFELLVARAGAASTAGDAARSIELFQEALGLVRGAPFTGGGARGFLWADNGVRAQIEFAIDEAAHKCADVALAAGDVEAARSAVFRGLSVIPWCEGCYRRRFRIAAADGNRTELKSAMADLETVLSVDANEPEGSDLVSDETLALYSQLLRGPAQRASSDAAVASSAAGG